MPQALPWTSPYATSSSTTSYLGPQLSRSALANVVLSDESRFNLANADGLIRVYRRRHERYANNCVLQHNNYGGGGVMVWAAINHRFKSQVIVCQGNLTARRYIDQILRPVIVPMFPQRQGLIFQHDNARPHVARVTRDFLQASNINVLPFALAGLFTRLQSH